MHWKRTVAIVLTITLLSLAVAVLFRKTVVVDTGRVTRGSMSVTVDEEGETRIHDRYVVAAPVAGKLSRIELHAGDPVSAGEVVALLTPIPLDPRERATLQAKLAAAQATKLQADAQVEHAGAEHELALQKLRRARQLSADGVISREALEEAETAETSTAKELDAAKFRSQAAAFEVEQASASLLAANPEQNATAQQVRLRSPVDGKVLRLLEQSERSIPAGTPVIELGHAPRLEVVIDLLSADAVKVRSGAPVLLEGWGGDHPLRGKVRLVEPAGFVKISALGIEEHRVNAIIDFLEPPDSLGDGFRIEARIFVWQADSVLKVPASAAFRHGENWSVFVVESGRARRRDIEIAHRNNQEVEILKGLAEGDQVIVHPSNQITEGIRVKVQNPPR